MLETCLIDIGNDVEDLWIVFGRAFGSLLESVWESLLVHDFRIDS